MASVDNILESVRADDFVEYYLFPVIETGDEKEQEVVLSNVLQKVHKIVAQYTCDYLWHKDHFKLVPRTSLSNSFIHLDGKKEKLQPHLYGISHYGDNIEDEWFIVFLLQEITREISGTIARICDADGEFLLIEAADYLPQWANPETCGNRVYIHKGSIHIVPIDENTEQDENDEPITVEEAVSTIRRDPEQSLAPTSIQHCIANKLNGYPDKIKDNLHVATAYLPVGVAAILKHKPNLVAPAVQALCNRDPIDVKACRAMRYFPPENRVLTNITLTKCLYAMLTHSKYLPDRRTGWNLPAVNSPQFKAHILGVKIASGFEILVSQAKPSEDINFDKGWNNFLNSLKNKNYFGDLLEHSRDYNNLLNKAKEYYINHRDSMNYTPAVGQEILELTRNLEYNYEELKKLESSLPKEDSDSWLDISPEELDKMLQEKYGQKKICNVNNNTDASEFTEKLTNFLNHMSSMEGAEFPNQDTPPVRPPRGIRKSKNAVSFAEDSKPEPEVSNRISFDPNQFTCAVQNILNFVIPEDDSWNLDTDSDMSDYADDNGIEESFDTRFNETKSKMEQYMEQMDKELASTSIGDSFEKKSGDIFDDIENFQPVDIDMNALKNMLESYRLQLGDSGPSSNMLGPMGIHLNSQEKQENGERE